MSPTTKAIVLLIAMLSIPIGLLAADDPFAGTWVLNAAKSKFDPGPPPKSLIYTYIPYGKDGGLKVHGGSVERGISYIRIETMDGKPFPYTANPAYDSGTRKRPDPYTITGEYFMKGKLLTTIDRVVSKDGNTMISKVKGKRPSGEPYEAYRVFDKVQPSPTAAQDPFGGTWVINAAKSKFDPRSPDKGKMLIYSYTPFGKDGGLKVHGEISGLSYIRAETMDGKPFAYTPNPAYDSATRKRPDLYTIVGEYIMKGKVLTTITRVASQDGKTMTMTVKSNRPSGEGYDDIRVYDQQ
jgi:hypothetical protein